jgi:hypothetical protein
LTLAVHRSRRTQPRHAAPKFANPLRLMLRVSPAGRGACGVIDGEVVDGEPARHCRACRCGFDPIDVATGNEFGA